LFCRHGDSASDGLFPGHDCGTLNGMKRITLVLTALFMASCSPVQADENPHGLPDGLYTKEGSSTFQVRK
jgi:hypothetical protein